MSSVSHSGRSKGARLHSARAQVKKITNPSGWYHTFQFIPLCWAAISFRLSEPDIPRDSSRPPASASGAPSRGPSGSLGSRAKVFYASQIDVRPPTVVLVVNKPDLFKGGYERYLLNQLHEHLPYSEVPIKLMISARKRLELSELTGRGRSSTRDKAERKGSGGVEPDGWDRDGD